MLALLPTLLLILPTASAQVLFEDDFDSHPDWTRLQPTSQAENCYPGIDCTGWNLPDGWDGLRNGFSMCQYNAPGYNNLYLDEIPGYPRETSGSCYGGGGKCITFWEEACQLSQGAYDDSDKDFSVDLGSDYHELYIRYRMKYSPEWQWGTNGINGGSPMWKLAHIQHHEFGSNPYSYFTNYNCRNSPVSVPGIGAYLGEAPASVDDSDLVYLNYAARCFAGADDDCVSDNYYCLGHDYWADSGGGYASDLHNNIGTVADNLLISDGDWHTLEIHVKTNTYSGGAWNADGVIELWIDGNLIRNQMGVEVFFGNAPTSPPRGYSYVSFGGNNNNDFVKSEDTADGEQWYAIDDVVISTSYIGPDYVIGGTPTCTDGDNDGYNASRAGCGPADCDDGNDQVNPGMTEVPYNGLDDDCSASTPDDDLDQDGYPLSQDCSPSDPHDDDGSINPGAPEVCEDGIDQDCDGSDLDPCPVCTDIDDDGYYLEAGCGIAVDCNDNNPHVFQNISCSWDGYSCGTHSLCILSCPAPPAEICDNSQDDDCDSLTDCSDPECSGQTGCPLPQVCDDIVLLHHFDQDRPDPQDSSGHGNHGTVNGAAYTSSGRFSGAFDFDGVDDTITVPHDSLLDLPDSGGAVSAWIRMDSANLGQDSYFPVIRKLDHTNEAVQSGYNMHFYQGSPTASPYLRGVLGSPDEDSLLSTNTPITDTGWHHALLTWDSSMMYLYLDGNEEASMARTRSLSWGQSQGIIIGKHTPWFIAYADGSIDEVAIWNRPLSAQEVSDLYTSNQPISCQGSQPIHDADLDGNGCIDMGELNDYIERWLTDTQDVSMVDVMGAVTLWRAGTGC